MQIGAVFPHEMITARGGDIAEFFSALEQAGLDYVFVFDHVAGAPYEQLKSLAHVPYVHSSPFYEVLTLLGFAAACTRRLELVTGVLVLPQRQTLLAAKQLATLDLLCDERLRIGLGVGWNPAEYAALGEDFSIRGAVLDEQISLLQRLWSDELVTSTTRTHQWEAIGIAPRPRRKIPLWFGGESDAALRRVAEQGEGWIPPMTASDGGPPDLARLIGRLDVQLQAAGRAANDVAIEGRVVWNDDVDELRRSVHQWREVGADRIAIVARQTSPSCPAEYLASFAAARDAIG